jgi:hypothetical protein
MATLLLIDLDLEEDLAKVYKDSKDTIKYLEDLVKSIDKRVLDGESIRGLRIVDGKKSRFITEPGFKYLEHKLGTNVVYEMIKTPITIGKLEALLPQEDMDALLSFGYISLKESSKKVDVE